MGLVLGSGGARGMAHVGVIKSLVKNKVPIDLIVGSSVGAFFGGLYAVGRNLNKLEEVAGGLTNGEIMKILADPTWGGGLVKGGKTLEYLKKIFAEVEIQNLTLPFCAVATDIITAKPVLFRKGNLAEAIRASISIPLMYEPVRYKNAVLVDGGVSCPVPVETAKDMGADLVIAVNLDGVYFSGNNQKNSHIGSTIDVLRDSYFALRYNLAMKEIAGAAVVIEPTMKFVEDFDFVGGRDAIKVGEKATEAEMTKIKKLLY